MCNILYMMDEALLCITGRGQLVKMLITLEPNGILGSNFAYLFIFNIVQPLVCKSVAGMLGEFTT